MWQLFRIYKTELSIWGWFGILKCMFQCLFIVDLVKKAVLKELLSQNTNLENMWLKSLQINQNIYKSINEFILANQLLCSVHMIHADPKYRSWYHQGQRLKVKCEWRSPDGGCWAPVGVLVLVLRSRRERWPGSDTVNPSSAETTPRAPAAMPVTIETVQGPIRRCLILWMIWDCLPFYFHSKVCGQVWFFFYGR